MVDVPFTSFSLSMVKLSKTLFSLHDDIITDDECNIMGEASVSFDVGMLQFHAFPTECRTDTFILEPTPIGPNGVAVPSFPLNEVLLSSDISQFDALQQLFRVDDLKAYHKPASSPSLSMPLLEQEGELVRSKSVASSMTPQEVRYGDKRKSQWNKRFLELVAFQEYHGHCLVPMQGYESPELSNWVKRQRCQYRRKMEGMRHTICDRRQKALEELGFVWDFRSTNWNERYEELKEYWRIHGHSNVPKSYSKNPALAVWVKCQRRQYRISHRYGRSSCTRDERIRLLMELDFDFDPRGYGNRAW